MNSSLKTVWVFELNIAKAFRFACLFIVNNPDWLNVSTLLKVFAILPKNTPTWVQWCSNWDFRHKRYSHCSSCWSFPLPSSPPVAPRSLSSPLCSLSPEKGSHFGSYCLLTPGLGYGWKLNELTEDALSKISSHDPKILEILQIKLRLKTLRQQASHKLFLSIITKSKKYIILYFML